MEATRLFLTGEMSIYYPMGVSNGNKRVCGLLEQFRTEVTTGIRTEAQSVTDDEVFALSSRRNAFGRFSKRTVSHLSDWHVQITHEKLTLAQHRVAELEAANMRLKEELRRARSEINEHREWRDAVTSSEHDDIIWWKLVRLHFQDCYRNMQAFCRYGYGNGFRYSDELKGLYTLMSLAGKFWYNILHMFMGFPGITSAKSFTLEAKRSRHIDNSLFDGSPINLQRQMEFYGLGSDRRIVVSIDATALKANFGLTPEGNVLGLTRPLQIDKTEAQRILGNEELFEAFRIKLKKEVAKYVFVVIVNPLDPIRCDFPVAVIPYHQGQVDDYILGRFIEINDTLRRQGYDVVGNGFDGDAKFRQFARKLCEGVKWTFPYNIADRVDIAFSRQPPGERVLPFFDPNHQAKCDRYRRVAGDTVKTLFQKDAKEFTRDDLKVLGIGDHVVSDSAARKMDDKLPRLLFNAKNLVKAIEKGRMDLFVALYPSTALPLAVMDADLSRHDRIGLLTDAFCVMFLFYESLLWYKPNAECTISLRRDGKSKISLWHREFAEQYLSSVYMILHCLMDPRPIHLGALGSHHNENLFGQIKRLSNSDESIERFMSSCERALLLKSLCREYSIDALKVNGRESMSGAPLPAEQPICSEPIGYHFCRAMELWKRVANYGANEGDSQMERFISGFGRSIGFQKWTDDSDALQLLPEMVRDKQKTKRLETITARKMRKV